MANKNSLNSLHYDNLPERVSSVEVQVQNLAVSLEQTNRAVENLADNVEKGFEKVGDKLSKRSETPWGTIFSGFGAVVVVLGWFLHSQTKPLEVSLQYEQRISVLQHENQQKTIDYLMKRVDNLENSH